jgi:hypothetical protein
LPGAVLSGMTGSDAARAAQVTNSNAFGPHYGPMTVDVLVGTAYVFLPRCNNRASMARRKSGQLTSGGQTQTVVLKCTE